MQVIGIAASSLVLYHMPDKADEESDSGFSHR